MRNLNEQHERMPSEAEIISLEARRNAKAEAPMPLVSKREVEDLRKRWADVQALFVDDPNKAVQQAAELTSSAIRQISESLQDQRSQLESEWSKAEMTTEDLRIALQGYRAFFDRLIAM